MRELEKKDNGPIPIPAPIAWCRNEYLIYLDRTRNLDA